MAHHEAGQDLARPGLDHEPDPGVDQCIHDRDPAHRAGHVPFQILADAPGPGQRGAVAVAQDRSRRLADLQRVHHRGEVRGLRVEQRRVECAGHVQRDPPPAEIGEQAPPFFERVPCAGDRDLVGKIDVGGPQRQAGSIQRLRHRAAVQPVHDPHRAGPAPAGGGHEPAAPCDQACRVARAQGPSHRQGGEMADAVPGEQGRPDPLVQQGPGQPERQGEDRRLRPLRLAQRRVRGVQDVLHDRQAGLRGAFLDRRRDRRQLRQPAPHARALRALAREHQRRRHHAAFPIGAAQAGGAARRGDRHAAVTMPPS